MVKTVVMYGEIRRLGLEGISRRSIAKQLHISRNTVKKYCEANCLLPMEIIAEIAKAEHLSILPYYLIIAIKASLGG